MKTLDKALIGATLFFGGVTAESVYDLYTNYRPTMEQHRAATAEYNNLTKLLREHERNSKRCQVDSTAYTPMCQYTPEFTQATRREMEQTAKRINELDLTPGYAAACTTFVIGLPLTLVSLMGLVRKRRK